MSEVLNVALAQLSPRLRDTRANLETMRRIVADLPGADLIVFPELYLSGYVLDGVEELALRPDGPELQDIADIAREGSTALIFGAPEHVEGGLANSAFCVDERWTIAAVYRKVQLFGGDESDAFVAGDELLVVSIYLTDPLYLSSEYTRSAHFKREPDASKWRPSPCRSL